MMKITQSLEYEGINDDVLRRDLQAWHYQHPFESGIDWQFQTMWATMSDELAFAFILKYPQYANKFRKI